MNENERIELEVRGISSSPISQSAYALLLKEMGGERFIPIVIGTTEAQSIALKLENIIPPRPVSHELMVTMMHAYGIELREIFIYDFNDGVFLCQLSLIDLQERETIIDSRVSDAIALAVRTGSPIFTTPKVFLKTCHTPDETITGHRKSSEPKKLEDISDSRLKVLLKQAIGDERYEDAAMIKRILDERKTEKRT